MDYKPGLYIVSTPIGNFKDITLRAIETLQKSNYILCEDTRKSSTLLEIYSIKTKLLIYNDYSTDNTREYVRKLIREGNVVSLIADAGTPLISDPGYKLVKFLQANQCVVEVVPGACSAIAALTISGMPSDKFIFLGFLPKGCNSKAALLQSMYNVRVTMIAFEAATRLISSLEIIYNIFGNIEICVVRELTKTYQEIINMPVENIIGHYKSNAPKGEIILLISPQSTQQQTLKLQQIQQKISDLVQQSKSLKDITNIMSSLYKKDYSKSEIYKIAYAIKHKSKI